MVDRMLFGTWVQDEIEKVHRVTSKAGWAPIPVGYREFNAAFPFSSQVLATDCSSFDWTYPEWVVETALECDLQMVDDLTPEYEQAIRARVDEVMGPNFLVQLPSGQILQQKCRGLMKSGWYMTLRKNGQAQFLMFASAWRELYPGEPFPTFWTLGDDTVCGWDGRDPGPLLRKVAEYGIIVKQFSHAREFAGFRFESEAVVNPCYPLKHMFELETVEESKLQELIDALGLVYALSNHPLAFWLRKRVSVAPNLLRQWALGVIRLSP